MMKMYRIYRVRYNQQKQPVNTYYQYFSTYDDMILASRKKDKWEGLAIAKEMHYIDKWIKAVQPRD